MSSRTERVQRLLEIAPQRASGRLQAHVEQVLGELARAVGSVCESPIEELFLLAWAAILEETRIGAGVPSWTSTYQIVAGPRQGWVLEALGRREYHRWFGPGVLHQMDFVLPQARLGKYRVDFLLIRLRQRHYDCHVVDEDRRIVRWSAGARECPRVVVECDGHDFHDRTKEQARRDRARDRLLQARGLRVLRFTGSELVHSPLRCADEVNRCLHGLGERRAEPELRGEAVILGGGPGEDRPERRRERQSGLSGE